MREHHTSYTIEDKQRERDITSHELYNRRQTEREREHHTSYTIEDKQRERETEHHTNYTIEDKQRERPSHKLYNRDKQRERENITRVIQ